MIGSPSFISWDLHGKFPAILKDEVVGEQATHVYEDAQKMIEMIIAKQLFKAKGIFGLFEANTIDEDDILITKNKKEIARFRTLRQQLHKKEGIPKLCIGRFYCTS